MMVAGSQDAIFMVESEAKELSEDQMLGAVLFAHQEMQKTITLIEELASKTSIPEIEYSIKEDNSEQDFFSAIKLCKKKRLGPARAEDNRTLFYKKDISLLARNGFDFETSKKVMDIEKDEYLKIINLL